MPEKGLWGRQCVRIALLRSIDEVTKAFEVSSIGGVRTTLLDE
jgi:hypothetical protein